MIVRRQSSVYALHSPNRSVDTARELPWPIALLPSTTFRAPRRVALTVMLLCTIAGGLRAGPVDVVVDAERVTGEINPLFRDFAQGGESRDPDFYAPAVDPMRALRPRMVRFDHVFDYFTTVDVRGDRLDVNFSPLERMLAHIEAMGAEPMVCLSYFPGGLTDGRSIDPPADFAHWRALIERTVRRLSRRSPPVRYYEVWNEPNLEMFWGADLERFLELYEVTSRTVRDTDPAARIGGAGFAGFPVAWIEGLLDHVKERGLPLDFLSWHEYDVDAVAVAGRARDARRMLAERGLDADLVLNEWNYHSEVVPGNDDHRAAVYIADHLRHMMDAPIAYAPFFEIKDSRHPDHRFWGRWGLLTADDAPKASYFAMLAHQRLGSERLALRSPERDIDGLATRDGERLILTLYNRSRQSREVNLRIEGLPRDAPAVAWKRWLIGPTHSNPARGTVSQLQHIEHAFPASGVEAGVLHRRLTLAGESVSLCEIEPAPTAPPAVRCALAPVADALNGETPREMVLAVRNKEARSVRVGPVSVVDDTGRPLPLRDMGSAQPIDATRAVKIEPNAERRWRVSLAVSEADSEAPISSRRDAGSNQAAGSGPRFARPAERFVLASITVNDEVTLRCGGAWLVQPSVGVELKPSRIVRPATGGPVAMALHLENRTGDRLENRLTWHAEAGAHFEPGLPDRYALRPRASSRLDMKHRVTGVSDDTPVVGRLEVRARIDGAPEGDDEVAAVALLVPSFDVPRAPRRLEIDGDLAAWRSRPPTGRLPVAARGRHDNRFWLGWDPAFLAIAVEVHDPQHEQSFHGPGLWQGDSVQFAFDMHWNSEPGRSGYDDDDVEIGMALGPRGPFCWVFKPFGDNKPGELDVPLAVVRVGERNPEQARTIYEVRLPWRVLSDRPFEPGRAFGMAIVLNDVDDQRRHFALWGAGIAEQPEPWRFIRMELKDAER